MPESENVSIDENGLTQRRGTEIVFPRVSSVSSAAEIRHMSEQLRSYMQVSQSQVSRLYGIPGRLVMFDDFVEPEDKILDRQIARLRQARSEQLKRWERLGMHSNFPKCCIKWFSYKWSDGVTESSNRRYTRLLRHRAAEGRCGFVPGYIPCPKCVRENRKVEVHFCTRACKV